MLCIASNQVERLRRQVGATSGRREDLWDQLVVFSFEWLMNVTLQRETILQIFSEQVPHARTMCRSP